MLTKNTVTWLKEYSSILNNLFQVDDDSEKIKKISRKITSLKRRERRDYYHVSVIIKTLIIRFLSFSSQ